MVHKIVGVRFKPNGKIYYFNPKNIEIKKGMHVIVETSRGLEYGEATSDITEELEENLVLPLKSVKRIADSIDDKNNKRNKDDAVKAMAKCKEYIQKHKLSMQLIEVEYTYDRSQLIFYFVAEERVDFRELVKDLASEFKTRIELRQVGIRDEAKVIGGIGPCGRILCCTSFIGDFTSISINMAKNQNLSLNPSKISGSCGRLLCCLAYENAAYKYLRKGLPDLGKKYKTKHGEGKVVYLDIINRQFKVDVHGHGIVELDYSEKTKK